MLDQNKDEFNIANINLWQKDNLGENTHIVVLDRGVELFKYYDNVTMLTFNCETGESKIKKNHGNTILATGYQIAPKAKVTYIPFDSLKGNGQDLALDWIEENIEDIDVITMSINYADRHAKKMFERFRKYNIPFFNCTGNETENEICFPAKYDYCIGVGSAYYVYKKISTARDMNYGEGIDIIGFSNIYYPNDDDVAVGQIGTSIATPFVAFSTLLYISWRKKNKLEKLTLDEWRNWQKAYALDMEEEGYDIKTGLGLFRLPNKIPILKKEEEEKGGEELGKASDYKIAVDAGHHFTTKGKETPFIPELGRRIKEHEFNAPTVAYLIEDLKRCGFKVIQTNSPKEDTPLKARTDKANAEKADVLVSIHYNAMGSEFRTVQAEGHSAHIYPKSIEGRKLAEHIMKYLVLGTPQKNRGIIEQNLHMTRESNMPAVLIENGFMDSKKEYKYMLDENFQKEVASEVAMGICSYFNVPYVMPTPVGGVDWDNKPMDSFVTKRELLQILGKLPSPEIPKPINPKSIRKYNTNIHIFEVGVDNKLDMDLGVRWEREKVSKIVQDKIDEGLDILCAINCGMFSYKEGSEHNTLYIDEGLYYNPPSGETMDFIYYKDGTTKIENIKGYDREKLSYLQNNAHWAIGTSYSLVQNGKINLENAEKFSHANSKEPRTQFGQLADGSFILVVTDGRTGLSAGLTAHEQAELMLSLGCINAVNVDGGGSSVMVVVVDGVPRIVNQLASGVERKVGSVMIAYQKGWV